MDCLAPPCLRFEPLAFLARHRRTTTIGRRGWALPIALSHAPDLELRFSDRTKHQFAGVLALRMTSCFTTLLAQRRAITRASSTPESLSLLRLIFFHSFHQRSAYCPRLIRYRRLRMRRRIFKIQPRISGVSRCNVNSVLITL